VSSGRHETALERELGGGAPMADGGSLAASVIIRGTSPGLGLNYRLGKERSLEDKASAWGT
jgi:lipoate-protein ligase A